MLNFSILLCLSILWPHVTYPQGNLIQVPLQTTMTPPDAMSFWIIAPLFALRTYPVEIGACLQVCRADTWLKTATLNMQRMAFCWLSGKRGKTRSKSRIDKVKLTCFGNTLIWKCCSSFFCWFLVTVEVNTLAQGALRQFTQWLWIEHPTFQLRGEHFSTEVLLFTILFNKKSWMECIMAGP